MNDEESNARAKRVAVLFADDDFQAAVTSVHQNLTNAVMNGPPEGRETALAQYQALKMVIARLASWKPEIETND